MQSKFAATRILIVCYLCCIGCMGESSTIAVRTAQVAFDEAVPLLNDDDYSQALPKLESAIQSGSLTADQFATALLMRSRCYAASSEFDKAKADIDLAEQGSPNEASLQIAKGYLLAKQGNEAESRSAYQAALDIDPAALIPKK
jgi:tetratricopeptide (TPR) repeat protein